jgi:hypothetical protein
VSVYHCPLCPLIFAYRTEVESHLREDHRSGRTEEIDLRAELQAAAGPLDRNRLQELRSSGGQLAVSLLLATTPAGSMSVLDVARLRQLADRARRRLPALRDPTTAAPRVEHRLARAVATAEGSATDRGLAVLVNPRQIAIVTLPFEPRDRAVVDQAFATRDLEYMLQRFPWFRVLVLGHAPRIFEGRGRDLAEVGPLRRISTGPGPQDVDAMLDQHVQATGIRPLVVIGDRRRLGAFRTHSRHAQSITAEVHRPRTRLIPLDQLAQAGLAQWRRDQQARVVAELQYAEAVDHVTWGLLATWRAVADRTAKRVWVEHDFAHPGRIVPGSDGTQLTSDPAEPGAVADLVDALISEADRRGVRVDLLDKGALNRPEPIAAELGGPEEPAAARARPEYAVCGAAQV